jgi:flagellar biosynthetic protein FliQ
MSEELILSVGSEAVKTMVFIGGPMLIAAMAIGIVVSVLQAITQINEATLTFIPKMAAVVLVLVVLAPWMLEVMKQYTTDVITQAGEVRK